MDDIVAALEAQGIDVEQAIPEYGPGQQEIAVRYRDALAAADGNLLMGGAEAVRTRYAKSMSNNPHLHYDIPNRIALGAWVIDEELVTGFTKPGSPDVARAVLIYRFSGDLIREIVILS